MSIELKIKGSGYGGLPSGTSPEKIVAEGNGSMEDRAYYRQYSSWGSTYDVRVGYLPAKVREQLRDIVGFQTDDECRTSAYFLKAV